MIYKTSRIDNKKIIGELEKLTNDIDVYTLTAKNGVAVVAPYDKGLSKLYTSPDLGPELSKLDLEVTAIDWHGKQAFEIRYKKKARTEKPEKGESELMPEKKTPKRKPKK